MIGGLIVDALMLGVIVAFAVAGVTLGARASLRRCVSAYLAFAVAALLRTPIGDLLHAVPGSSLDFARLLGMVLVAIGTFVAASRIMNHLLERRGEQHIDDDESTWRDPRRERMNAAIPGLVLGVGWMILMTTSLVLMPSGRFISEAAARSVPGDMLIRNEAIPRWFVRGFPHYTQTLPKGHDGSVIGPISGSIPVRHVDVEPARIDDAEQIQRVINQRRIDAHVTTLVANRDLDQLAEQQAANMFTHAYLDDRTPGGESLASRIDTVLALQPGSYGATRSILIWTHSAPNALDAMLGNTRIRDDLASARFSEIGIGVVDGGWYNGRMVVVLLAQRTTGDDTDAAPADVEDPSAETNFDRA